MIPVPNPNREFRYNCPNGASYTEAELSQKVLFARQFMHPDKPDYQYPIVFDAFRYGITGELWYYPMIDGSGPYDYVVFNTENRVVGAISSTYDAEGREMAEPCDLT
ncbi:BgTH12-04532 [Blumeria graminis f. sp. triticale]|nr:BgTH12-04532 [Blumeria graminis f. sp. triticale]